jgi:hypothetical protein
VIGHPGQGATTLALALLAGASQAGSWCAAVGVPDPGVVAAAELGIDLRRVVFVPYPGPAWAEAAGDLMDGVDVVLVRPPARPRLTAARHLGARARERKVALVVLADRSEGWPEGADLTLSVTGGTWEGVGRGHGHLEARRVTVEAGGRRAAGATKTHVLWLPGKAGTVAAPEDGRPDGSAVPRARPDGSGDGPAAA